MFQVTMLKWSLVIRISGQLHLSKRSSALTKMEHLGQYEARRFDRILSGVPGAPLSASRFPRVMSRTVLL